MTEIKIQPNQVFKWPKGLRLSATGCVTMLFPGSLLKNDEKIGSIIEVPDSAEIGFREGTFTDQPDCFIVKLKPGMSIRLNRSTHAIVHSVSDNAAVFKIEVNACP